MKVILAIFFVLVEMQGDSIIIAVQIKSIFLNQSFDTGALSSLTSVQPETLYKMLR